MTPSLNETPRGISSKVFGNGNGNGNGNGSTSRAKFVRNIVRTHFTATPGSAAPFSYSGTTLRYTLEGPRPLSPMGGGRESARLV